MIFFFTLKTIISRLYLFYNLLIVDSSLCQNDALIVHNGIDAKALVEKRICGKTPKIVITSRWRSLFVIFTSDSYHGRNAKGFRASFAEGLYL